MANTRSARLPDALAVFTGIAFLGLVELRTLLSLLGPRIALAVSTEELVSRAQADWRAYQNRLAGPLLEALTSRLFHVTFAASHRAFVAFFVVASNAVAYLLLERLTRDRRTSLAYTACFAACFIAIQDGRFLFVWDCIDLVVFTLFAYAALAGVRLRLLVALFFAELVNRESALFIALWLVLQGFSVRDGRLRVAAARPALVGVALGAVGVAYTLLLRRLVWSPLPDALELLNPVSMVGGTHLHAVSNLRAIYHNGLHEPAVPLFYPLLAAWVWLHRGRFDERAWHVVALVGAMMLSTFLFGVLFETRILTMVLPLLVFLHASLPPSADRAADAR